MTNIKLILGDCLEVMKTIPDKSIDLVLTDPPYSTTPCDWDKAINLNDLWGWLEGVKATTPIVIFSQQPFTSILISSMLEMYKYNWIWIKDSGTNFLNSHYQPLKITEDICVFGLAGCSYNPKRTLNYYPQFHQGKPYRCISGNQKDNSAVVRGGTGGREDVSGYETISDGKRYPNNVLYFKRDKEKLHPTQKPVELIKYLIKTYSKQGDTILDPFMGSGTTGVACKELDRNFIGIEISEKYFKIAERRINQTMESLF